MRESNKNVYLIVQDVYKRQVLYCLMNFVKAVKGFREASANEV